MIRVEGARSVLTDIEGTTSSIAFVHDVLFPYSRTHMADFVERNRHVCAPLLQEVRAAEGVEDGTDTALVAVLRRWIDEDRKAPPLKILQGMIWREGYASGELTAHFYDDAVRNLRAWRALGLGVNVFSSGSVEAQKLLFAHSVAGDLTLLVNAYFDTAVGPKTSKESYSRIVIALGLDPAAVLFLSDTPAEVSAAISAGLQAIRIVRGGEVGPGEAASFDQIDIG